MNNNLIQYKKLSYDREPRFEMNQTLDNKNKPTYETKQQLLTKGELCDDELSKIYFSDENVLRIQKMIKQEVFIKTKGKYKLEDDQDESDLLVVMKSIFFEYAKHLPFKLVHQVKALNKKTMEAIIPDIITNIKQSYDYLKEINEPLKPIDRPVNVNNAGRKTLPSLTTVYGF